MEAAWLLIGLTATFFMVVSSQTQSSQGPSSESSAPATSQSVTPATSESMAPATSESGPPEPPTTVGVAEWMMYDATLEDCGTDNDPFKLECSQIAPAVSVFPFDDVRISLSIAIKERVESAHSETDGTKGTDLLSKLCDNPCSPSHSLPDVCCPQLCQKPTPLIVIDFPPCPWERGYFGSNDFRVNLDFGPDIGADKLKMFFPFIPSLDAKMDVYDTGKNKKIGCIQLHFRLTKDM